MERVEVGLEMPDLAAYAMAWLRGYPGDSVRAPTWFRRVMGNKMRDSGWEQTRSYQVPVGPM